MLLGQYSDTLYGNDMLPETSSPSDFSHRSFFTNPMTSEFPSLKSQTETQQQNLSWPFRRKSEESTSTYQPYDPTNVPSNFVEERVQVDRRKLEYMISMGNWK